MRSFALLAGLLSLVSSSIALSDVFESLRTVPYGWTELRDPSPETRIHLRIALKQPNPGLLEQTILAVSTPDSEKYGQHLKRDELKALLKPAEDSTDAVLTWLKASGVAAKDIDNDGDWVHFYVSVSKANAMMSTTFHVYGNSIDKSEAIRTLQYSVPANVSAHITMIQPT
jgi:tripeptidyl-peptidase-1